MFLIYIAIIWIGFCDNNSYIIENTGNRQETKQMQQSKSILNTKKLIKKRLLLKSIIWQLSKLMKLFTVLF